MQKTHAFAILAPVPEEHLLSGLDAVCFASSRRVNAAQLDSDDLPPNHLPKVAFGSMNFEVFGEAEKLRGGQAIEVLIYASHAKGDQPLNPEATWHRLYVGSVGSRRGRYPGKAIYRPKSTATDSPTWAVFWEVQGLERLKMPLSIGSLRGKDKKTNYQTRFLPEGSVLIEFPESR